MTTALPITGIGVGLRKPHLETIAVAGRSEVPFWEIAPENVMGQGGRRHKQTMEILARDPVLTHGITLSVGGLDPFDGIYLDALARFLEQVGTPFHSEHLCWSSHGGAHTHELLPLPFTWEAARHTVARVKELQGRLPVPLLLENITYYAELGAAEMSEGAFLTEVLEGADCGWLLDINNVYVNSRNHGFDPKAWLAAMPLHRVRQMHIAGHLWDEEEQLLLDTHGEPVASPVIELFQWVLPRLGRPVPVLLERDNNLPDLPELLAERARLQVVYDGALAGVSSAS